MASPAVAAYWLEKARQAGERAVERRDRDKGLRAGLATADLLANADERIALVGTDDEADYDYDYDDDEPMF